MLSGNKGEWSEVYVHLKLLADGVLYAADADLNLLKSLYFPIIKIIRRQDDRSFEYLRNGDIVLIDSETQGELLRFPIRVFLENSELLFNKIKSTKGRSFKVPEIEDFLGKLKISTLSAKSSDKSDITIKVHDHRTGYDPELGFSIKSMLGSSSTLFNAGTTTNFVYKICGGVRLDIKHVNSITKKPKIKNRIDYLKINGYSLEYVRPELETFLLNLQLIDTSLPQILANLLLYNFEGSCGNRLCDLLTHIENKNPLNFNLEQKHPFYQHKLKAFLTDAALGMTPAKVWYGIYDATGGMIFVKKNGDILCYHIYNRNEFQNYLITTTRLEKGSTKKHKYGQVYEENGEYFIKLNLQIRFID